MTLIENWKETLKGAWSVWLIALGCVLSAVPVFVSLVSPGMLGVDPVVFAAAAAVVNALAIPARLVAQDGLSQVLKDFRQDVSGAVRRQIATSLGAAALVISMAMPFIANWEGVKLEAYRDIVGRPTICFGDTHGVQIGDSATMAECVARLERDMQIYYQEIRACMSNPDIPVGVQASLLELAYNVGTPSVCRSTMMRLANAAQYSAACDELHKWVKAGGERIRGLQNRRADSKRSLCLNGLT